MSGGGGVVQWYCAGQQVNRSIDQSGTGAWFIPINQAITHVVPCQVKPYNAESWPKTPFSSFLKDVKHTCYLVYFYGFGGPEFAP